MLAILVAALGCIMAGTNPAAAELAASQLSGRWSVDPRHRCHDASCQLAYDLVPCGDGWCGIEVRDGKACGRIAFRLDAGAPKPYGVEFLGHYERAQETQPYVVSANLYVDQQRRSPNEQLLLSVFGSTDGNFQPFRRSYPLHMVLARDGDAKCRAQPKIS
jgi:hypothetical protein